MPGGATSDRRDDPISSLAVADRRRARLAEEPDRDGSDGDATVMPGDGTTGDLVRDIPQLGTSEVGAVALAGIMELRQSVPNPVSGEATISYELNHSGAVMLRLYDERGMEVMVLEQGERGAGEHVVRVDVSGLASGVYHYRLEVGGRMLSRLLRVVR